MYYIKFTEIGRERESMMIKTVILTFSVGFIEENK